MFAALKNLVAQAERMLAGPLASDVRRNMHLELIAALAYGAFYATTLAFVPVVLRRSGATPELLALYTSQQFIGSVVTAFSIVLMRRRRTMNVILACWLAGRSLFIPFAFLAQPIWMIALSGFYWLLELFPAPGYTRILQKIYPDAVRGKLMSIVRMGRVSTVMLVTPLAGWALDHFGYAFLFPVGGFLGILAVLLFAKLDVNEGPLPARQTKTLAELVFILRQDRRFAYYLLSFTVYGMGTLMSWTLYPLVQVDRLGLSYSELGLLGMIQSTFWLVGYLFWGRLVDQRGGLFVLRATCGIAVMAPFSYIWATEGWMLIPAFMAQGVINAGWDMGLINAGIQLADAERVTEYAAIQATVVGLRGVVAPLVGVGLLRLGIPDNGVFVIGATLVATGWVMFGRVRAPLPTGPEAELRHRWPLRFRLPRI